MPCGRCGRPTRCGLPLAVLNPELESHWGVRLQSRIGVNTGEVVAGKQVQGGPFVVGDAVNLAARLEQAAAAGEILIGEQTEQLVRDAVRAESVEPLALKGKAEPVPGLQGVRGTSRDPVGRRGTSKFLSWVAPASRLHSRRASSAR